MRIFLAALAVAVGGASALALGGARAVAGERAQGGGSLVAVPTGCNQAAALHRARCLSAFLTVDLRPLASSGPSGYGPADLRSAYALSSASASGGTGQTVAVVDAMDDPNAEADLGVYRSTYGLPPCTTANGCFRKVNQAGVAGSYPAPDQGWATEISLDVDMVSAICPNCRILLVEASSASDTDLLAGVDEAAALGANAISNSYGEAEPSGETSLDTHLNHPGRAITASSGDSGYGVSYPAASQFVTAVGGTSLSRSSGGRGWTETAWSGAGSGCSAQEPKPSWQHDSGCAARTVADVSADADPSTGVAVYDTYVTQTCLLICLGGSQPSGWLTVGGTSVGAPLIASVYALAGNASSVVYGSFPYSHLGGLFDVTSGSNCSGGGGLLGLLGLLGGTSCPNNYLSNAGPGYDGPTGLGTPNGTSGF